MAYCFKLDANANARSHVLCCFWYFIGSSKQPQTHGRPDILGWVEFDFGNDTEAMQVSLWRRYLFSFHAVNPKMFDLHDAVSGDFLGGTFTAQSR